MNFRFLCLFNGQLLIRCDLIGRAAIDYEKKGYAENYEHGKVMEQKLVAMARELEKLRAEIANSESRAPHAAGPVGNPGMVKLELIMTMLSAFVLIKKVRVCVLIRWSWLWWWWLWKP